MTENHEWLRQLVGWMIDYQEEERRRVAREVHGELGRCLTEMAVELGLLRSALRGTPNDDATAHIAAMSELVSQAATAVRRVTSPLRASVLDAMGLRIALQEELAAFGERTGVAVTLTFEPAELQIDAARATALYRIAQEALANAERHAGAKHVAVRIDSRGGWIDATVTDDGRGITPEEIGNVSTSGLADMRERAYAAGGEFAIEGTRGAGTRVHVSFPQDGRAVIPFRPRSSRPSGDRRSETGESDESPPEPAGPSS